MSTSTLNRRAALVALGAVTLAAVAASHGALRAFHSSATRRSGGCRAAGGERRRPTAGWVAQYLPGQIAQNLARRGVSADASVRIDYLTLGPNSGGVGPAVLGNDSIEGVATINGVEMPVRGDVEPLSHGCKTPSMTEQSNRDRVSQVTEALAFWIAQDAQGVAAAGPRG